MFRSLAKVILYPNASTENQGRAIENIFLSIDTKTQGLIEIPIAIDHETKIQVTRMQGSIALACLIKTYMVKDLKTSESYTRFVSIISATPTRPVEV
jgi:hypothetical protein